MTTITTATPMSLPGAAAAPYDPFAELKREIRTIVTASASDAFEQQQPLIRRTIGDAIEDQTPAIRLAASQAIADQLPAIRTELDDFVADTRPQMQTMVDETIDRVKRELPGVIDAEVARQRQAIQAEVKPIVEQQVSAVRDVARSAAIGGGVGLVGGGVAGFLLGARAWNGASGGLLGAAGMAALGATAGVLVGAWRGASGLEAAEPAT